MKFAIRVTIVMSRNLAGIPSCRQGTFECLQIQTCFDEWSRFQLQMSDELLGLFEGWCNVLGADDQTIRLVFVPNKSDFTDMHDSRRNFPWCVMRMENYPIDTFFVFEDGMMATTL